MRSQKEGLTGLTDWSLSQIEERQKVAPVIKAHIVKLAELSGRDLHLIVDGLRLDPYVVLSSQTRLKENAFTFLATKQIWNVARANNWDLNSNEVKYMSGVMIQPHITRRIEWLGEQVDALRSGKRRYLSEKKSKERLVKEERDMDRLSEINSTLTQNLEVLASTSFLDKEDGEKYIEILRRLAMIYELKPNGPNREQIKRDIPRFLKVGDINGAYNYLNGFFVKSQIV